MTTISNRVPAGVPTGGQFAPARHDEPADVALSLQTVALPDLTAKTPNDLWAALGMSVDDNGRYVPTGVHRRLSAGLSSVAARGFDARQLEVTDGPWSGIRRAGTFPNGPGRCGAPSTVTGP